MICLVPAGQPEISQTRSVWYRGKRKTVLNGRWKQHLNNDCRLEIPPSFQDESICASNPDTSCLANFRRRSATFQAQHKVIVALTVQEILDEHIAKKLV
jgi:hypothetical protein